MIFFQVVTAVLRRWYVPLVVLMAAAALTTHLVRAGSLYETRTVVMFVNLAPNQAPLGPDNGSENDSIIAFAGTVATDINNGRPVFRYAQNDAPLYGAGISQGVFVGLRTDGGQWGTNFSRAELEIEIVGRTREYVESMQQDLLSEIYTRTRDLQGPAYDKPETRILAQVVPLTLAIDYVSASRSQLVIAVALMLAAAMIVGSWGAVRFEAILGGHGAGRKRKMKRDDVAPGRRL